MSEQTVTHVQKTRIPGFDAEATPLIGIGLGLTGLALGLRPRLAPLPLALTALTALLYRDPHRSTPDDPSAVFAVADGTVLATEELYEHRYLHTDAVRISLAMSPLDVPVLRSPVNGTVRYIEHVSGEFLPVNDQAAAEQNERTYIGIDAPWGPLLIVQIASPFARRLVCNVQLGDHVEAGERIGLARFGARVDLIIPCDAVELLVSQGQSLKAGIHKLGSVELVP
jgi:phosphatidylserine decarboxylase